MIVDIEPEYVAHVHNQWRKFLDLTGDLDLLHAQAEKIHTTISDSSIKFLQDKLENIENQTTAPDQPPIDLQVSNLEIPKPKTRNLQPVP